MTIKGATFLVQHFLQKDASGWPRVIDIYTDDVSGEFRFMPKTHRVLQPEEGGFSQKSLPALVSHADILEAIQTANLYMTQVVKK